MQHTDKTISVKYPWEDLLLVRNTAQRSITVGELGGQTYAASSCETYVLCC